ncbi:SapC family protein [Aestuariibacter salexigens]|uniref:SapC family protein n=1 Tax=Aestuariibacter salexigens TaxID=226010 RepID=UPI00040C5735|nr:SapC family protein [Aestuariibacter salexigens]
MAINYVPLDKDKHAALKVKQQHNFEYSKNAHLSAASIREFAQLAGSMPIVIIQDPKSNNYHCVAMLGVEPNKNMFWADDRWNAPAVPWNVQRYPFDVRPDGDKLGVYVDENSDLLVEDGLALFDEEGNPTEFMRNRHQFLGDLANSEMMTQRFLKKIAELDLLEPIQLLLTYENGQQRNVTGMFSISEKRLHELSDDVIVELHKAGFLGAIYAMLMSLGQLNRLVELSNNTDTPIRNLQLSVVKQDDAQAPQQESAPQA